MRLLFLPFFLSICGVFIAQKPILKLEVEPRSVEEGEMFSITVKSNIQGDIKIDYPSSFIEGYAVSSGMQQESDLNSGKVITLFYYVEEGMFRKSGTYTIGPAYIKSNGKTFKSNTVSVNVNKEPVSTAPEQMCAKKAQLPAFGLIVKNKNKVYQGEPVVVHAKVYSRFYPSHFDDYKAFEPNGILEKHQLSSNNRLVAEETKVQNTPFYTFDYDRTLIFPSVPGRQKIDPFKLILRRGFDGLPVVSSPGSIEVLPLPANKPKSFIGMVGNLEMSVECDKEKVKKNDVVHLTVTLKGAGNLHAIEHPIPQLPKGVTTYGDPKKTEDLIFSAKGAEGTVNFEYTLKVNRDGNLDFPSFEVAYFDPKTEKYKILSQEIGSISGEESVNAHAVDKGETKVLSASEESENKTNENELWRSPYVWLGLLSVLAIGGVVGLVGRPKPKNETVSTSSERTSYSAKTTLETTKIDEKFSTYAANNEYDKALSELEKAIKNVLSTKSGIPEHEIVGSHIKRLVDEHFSGQISGEEVYQKLQLAQTFKYSWEINETERVSVYNELLSVYLRLNKTT